MIVQKKSLDAVNATKKSHTQDKLNLLADADSRTNTKTDRNEQKKTLFIILNFYLVGKTIVHKKRSQKVKGDRKVSGRGSEGERKGSGR